MVTPASSSACRLISSIERTAILNTSLPFMVMVCSLLRTVSAQDGLREPPAGTYSCLTYDPSVRSLVLSTPEPFSEAPSTTAPAASPNRIQVPRSFQLSMRLKASEPTTSALSALPLRTNKSPTASALRNPAQAAPTSKENALRAPSLSSSTQAE